MAGKPRPTPPGKKRCANSEHEGDRMLPASRFAEDRSASDGLRSSCRDCYNGRQRERRAADGGVHYAEQQTRYKRERTARADARDEKYLAEQERLERERRARLESDIAPLKADDFSSDDDYDTRGERPTPGRPGAVR
jgi:hypothetical protein